MTESDTETNMALMLDEKIEERIHVAVSKLFGFDPTTQRLIHPDDTPTASKYAKEYTMREIYREVFRGLVNDTQFVETMFERMMYVQHNRRQQYWGTTNPSSRFF